MLAFYQRWFTAPVTEEEIGKLSDAVTGNASQSDLLKLAREMMRQENVAPDAAQNLCDALRLLGNAAERLPAATHPQTAPDTLRQAADAARAEANRETDPVTQASLLRRADALERSAASAVQAAIIAKRTEALRGELAAQTQSLRLGLAAYQTGDTGAAGLAALSENIRTVAAEAVSAASARAELDAVSVPLAVRR